MASLLRILTTGIFLGMCQVAVMYAQPSISWDHSYGGKGDDDLVEILVLDNGDYILAGSSVSPVSGDKTAISKGWMDFWVVRIDSHGNIVLDRTFGGDKRDEMTSAILTKDGNILLGGSSTSGISGDKTGASRGGTDYWIVLIDLNGNLIWEKTFGGDRDDFLENIIESPGDGFVLAGVSYSGMTGDKSEPQKREGSGFLTVDNWIIRISSAGDIMWDRTLGGSEVDSFGMMKFTETSVLTITTIYNSFDYQSLPTSDIKFTPENPSLFSGYWWAEIDDDDGSLIVQDHFGIGAYGYDPLEIVRFKTEEGKFGIQTLERNYRDYDGVIETPSGDEIYPIELSFHELPFQPLVGYNYNGGKRLPQLVNEYDEIDTESGVAFVSAILDDVSFVTNDILFMNTRLGGNGDEKNVLIKSYEYGILLGATSNSDVYEPGFKSDASEGRNDFWIVKLSPDDNVEPRNWNLSLGDFKIKPSYGEYVPFHITEGIPEGVVVATYARGFDGVLKTSDDAGLWIAQVNPEGNLGWERTLITQQPRRVVELLTHNDGYYVGSVFPADFRLYPEKKFSSVFFLTKLDSEGNLIWEKEYPVPHYGAIEGMALATDQSGVLLNFSLEYDYSLITNQQSVSRLNSMGEIEWQYQYQSSYYQFTNYGIESVAGIGYLIGDYYLLTSISEEGTENWIVDHDELPSAGTDKNYFYGLDQYQGPDDPIWSLRLRKRDYDGNLIDQVQFMDFASAGAFYFFRRPDNGFVVFEPIGGQYIEIGPDLTQMIYSSLYKDQNNGHNILDFVDASPMDRLNYVRLIYDADYSNYYLSARPYTFTPVILSGMNEQPITFSDEQPLIYPNPARDYVWITGFGEIREIPEAIDLTGRTHKLTFERIGDRMKIDLSGLIPGVYILQLIDAERINTIRLIKN